MTPVAISLSFGSALLTAYASSAISNNGISLRLSPKATILSAPTIFLTSRAPLAFETVLQLYVAEGVEHIREMYLVSYSLPNASKVVYKTITSKLEDVFKGSLPELETKDFYELEIASAGIMRGYISVPCDMYFTMERKRKRFLETLFKIYDVPKEKVIDIIKFIEQFDFKKHADDLLKSLFNYLESKI